MMEDRMRKPVGKRWGLKAEARRRVANCVCRRVSHRTEAVGRGTYANVGELDEGVTPRGARLSVLDNHHFPDSSVLEVRSSLTRDRSDSCNDLFLGRQGVESSEEEDLSRRRSNISSSVVHIEPLWCRRHLCVDPSVHTSSESKRGTHQLPCVAPPSS